MKIAIIEGERPTLMPEGPQIEREILGPGAEIKCHGEVKPGEYSAVLGDLDAVITRPGAPFSKEMISALKKAKVIVSLGVGYEHIDIKAANRKGIPVCNVPNYGTEEVADTTAAMILAHQRKINLFSFRSAGSDIIDWDWRIHRPIMRTGKTRVGIIGLGRIGTAVAMRLKAFGYAINFYDPYLACGFEKSLALGRIDSMEAVVSSSDIISIHTPLTQETSGLVDDRFFDLMKSSAILINTARGGIFKSADVIHNALKSRPQIRIGTDVWPEEPPKNHPLLKAWRDRAAWLGDRLIICPHSAFYSESATQEIRAFAAEVVKAILDGKEPYNVINGD